MPLISSERARALAAQTIEQSYNLANIDLGEYSIETRNMADLGYTIDQEDVYEVS
jgi:hypothetical protein